MRGVNQFSYEDTHTYTHSDSLLQTPAHINSPLPPQTNKFPLSTNSRKHNYIHPYSLSTFSLFNPADTKTRTHFCSKFDGIELLLWVISLTLQGQVEKCSPSQSLSVSNILPLSPEDTCTHKQTASSHVNTCCLFAYCFDVHSCLNSDITRLGKIRVLKKAVKSKMWIPTLCKFWYLTAVRQNDRNGK